MSNASELAFSKLDEQKEAKQYVGPCPKCGKPLKLPQALFTDVFTDEIQCPTPPGCGHRLSVRFDAENGAYLLYDLGDASRWEMVRKTSIDWERLAAVQDLEGLFEVSAQREKWESFLGHLQRYQHELAQIIDRAESMRGRLEERLTAFEAVFSDGRVDDVLAKARWQVENTSDEIGRVATSSATNAERVRNDLSELSEYMSGQLAKYATDLVAFRRSLKGQVESVFASSSQKFKSISDSFVVCAENAQRVAKKLEQLGASADHVAGRFDSSLKTADAVAERFAGHLRKLIFDRKTIEHIIREAATGTFHEVDDSQRNDVVEKLPVLVDYLECELMQWRTKPSSDETRQSVVQLLNNLLRAIYHWMNARGIERFGEANDKYDYALHDIYGSCESLIPDCWNRVKEVAYSGYRLRSTQTLLRRARVVIWEKPVGYVPEEVAKTPDPARTP